MNAWRLIPLDLVAEVKRGLENQFTPGLYTEHLQRCSLTGDQSMGRHAFMEFKTDIVD
jgi:hypothetical protein